MKTVMVALILLFGTLCFADTQAEIAGDLQAVQRYREGLQSVLRFAATQTDLFPPVERKEDRIWTSEQRTILRSVWQSFWDYVLALDSIGKKHQDYYKLNSPLREESFSVAYSAFLAGYRHSLDFIQAAERNEALDKILNERVSGIGMPEGSYARLKFRFLNAGRAAEFSAMEAIYRLLLKNKIKKDVALMIQQDSEVIWRVGKGRGEMLTVKNAGSILKKAGFTAWFPVQCGVSEWMGDTKVYRVKDALVSQEQIAALHKKLLPGDVLLERREWYLSNIGLPGFWPHAALYIGTPEERRAYFTDTSVKSWVIQQGQVDGDFEALLRSRSSSAYSDSLKEENHHAPRILEAMSEGVSFTTLEHSAEADSVAVLRPRLTQLEKAIAILRSFQYAGRPYDFDFDFQTDSSIVCTELIFKSYEADSTSKGLQLPLVTILGRKATPANEIVRQFDEQYGTPEQQFDLVVFLDGQEWSRKAIESDLKTFRESWKRPKWHIVTAELR